MNFFVKIKIQLKSLMYYNQDGSTYLDDTVEENSFDPAIEGAPKKGKFINCCAPIVL
jgi:hypothetical protein